MKSLCLLIVFVQCVFFGFANPVSDTTSYVQTLDITSVFFSGADTINTPSGSADSRKIAFVSYAVKEHH